MSSSKEEEKIQTSSLVEFDEDFSSLDLPDHETTCLGFMKATSMPTE